MVRIGRRLRRFWDAFGVLRAWDVGLRDAGGKMYIAEGGLEMGVGYSISC